jgi:CubicO group peptidase (beta-lactamase class C family)
MRRLGIVVVSFAVAAGAVGVALDARDGRSAAARPTSACHDWVAAPAYRREIESVRALVPRMKGAFAAPGLSVAVAARGKLVWSQSCGFADLKRRLPVTRRTQFRIGSVSKSLTAATVARLQQNRRIDLDEEIQTYVAAFPRTGPAPTLRQLGGHLGGIRHYQGSEAMNTTHYRSLSDSLRVFIADPLVAPPGAEFHYSSYGFNLLGAAVETATKTDFAHAVHAAVLQPLGMRRTTVGRAPTGGTRFYEVTSARRAVPAPRIDLSDRYPSGGFLSTAEDLVRLGIGVTDDRFLDPGSQTLLFTSQSTRAGKPTGYGFGFETGRSPVGPVAGHTGNVVGGTAFILVHPRTRVVVALVTNIGFVTVRTSPDLSGAPDPPQLAMSFIRRVLRRG